MITDRIGRQEVLLPINHDHFNYRKKQIHLEQISPVEMSEVKKRQSKTACGYWYGTVFIAFKRTRSCIMTLEGRDAEYLPHKQNRKPDASKNINEYPVPQKKDDCHNCLNFFRRF